MKSMVRQLRWSTAGLIALALAAVRPAWADEGPVFGRTQKREWLTLDPFSGSVNLSGRVEQDTTSQPGSPKVTSTDTLLEQTLTLRTQGAVVHPNLMEFHIAANLGVSEEFLNAPGQQQTNTAFVNGYDLSTTILRNEATPVTVFARRSEDFLIQPFAGSLHETTSDYGGRTSFHKENYSLSLSGDHSEQQQTDLSGGGQNFSATQDNVAAHLDARPTDRQILTLDYHYNSLVQSSTSLRETTFDSQEASAGHEWFFDDDHRYTLTSNLDVYTQSGDYARDSVRLDERLRLQHTDEFETHYQYSLQDQTSNGIEQLTNQGQAGFRHQLFESLTTTGNVGANFTNRSDGGNVEEYMTNLNFDYTKKVPLGVLGANFGIGYDHQTTGATGSATQVINDPLTYTVTSPTIFIYKQNINPGSIALFNHNGLHLLTPGFDYTVRAFPDHVEIRPIPGGAIIPGDALLADYTIEPNGGATSGTTSLGTGVRYDFREGPLKGLGFFVRYQRQDQTVDTPTPGAFLPDNVQDVTYGSEYSLWHITLNAEQEFHDSSLTPYNALRFGAKYSDSLSHDLTLNLSANYSLTHYTSENDTDEFMTASGNLEYRLTRELTSTISTLLRNENDSLYGKNSGVDGQLEVRWKHRQTQIFGALRGTLYDSNSTENTSLMLQVGIQRDF